VRAGPGAAVEECEHPRTPLTTAAVWPQPGKRLRDEPACHRPSEAPGRRTSLGDLKWSVKSTFSLPVASGRRPTARGVVAAEGLWAGGGLLAPGTPRPRHPTATPPVVHRASRVTSTSERPARTRHGPRVAGSFRSPPRCRYAARHSGVLAVRRANELGPDTLTARRGSTLLGRSWTRSASPFGTARRRHAHPVRHVCQRRRRQGAKLEPRHPVGVDCRRARKRPTRRRAALGRQRKRQSGEPSGPVSSASIHVRFPGTTPGDRGENRTFSLLEDARTDHVGGLRSVAKVGLCGPD
jgi:hypothetical protein